MHERKTSRVKAAHRVDGGLSGRALNLSLGLLGISLLLLLLVKGAGSG
jgi:hypothetical protein